MKPIVLSLLVLSSLISDGCADDASAGPDANDTFVDAAIDASDDIPDSGLPPICAAWPAAIPCWAYDGPERIGDQTCEHGWHLDTTNSACWTQKGWVQDGTRFSSTAPTSVFEVARPAELRQVAIALQIFYGGSEQYRDMDFVCDSGEMCSLTPSFPDQCECPLRNSQTLVELLSGDIVQLSAISLATSDVEVFAHLFTDMPWDILQISAEGEGELLRYFHDVRLVTRTSL